MENAPHRTGSRGPDGQKVPSRDVGLARALRCYVEAGLGLCTGAWVSGHVAIDRIVGNESVAEVK